MGDFLLSQPTDTLDSLLHSLGKIYTLAVLAAMLIGSCAKQLPMVERAARENQILSDSWQQVIDAQLALLAKEPDNHDAYFKLGRAHFHLKQWHQAATALESSISINAHSAAGAYYYLGKSYEELYQSDAAIAAYEKALSYQPGLVRKLRSRSLYRLTTLLLKQGRYRGAKNRYRQLKKLDRRLATRLDDAFFRW